ncbi:helix-turn-helix domain-containing protein [Streptomyces sp. NPDC004609]|uniref:AraC-like ligand-binding domain-containing protein n=1 Tax=Streptomyces sp. NPDC004609 TaxID=3364704 RepID=UPI0036D0210F
MLVTEFSTESVSRPERFALFQEVADRWHVPNSFRSDQGDDFRASMRILDLGSLHVTSLAYPHLEVNRSLQHIRGNDSEVLQFHILLQGTGTFAQGQGETSVRPMQLVVVDSSRPYRGTVTADLGAPCSLVLLLPRRGLPLPQRTLRDLTATAVPAHSGIGAVFARWLADLSTLAPQFQPADAPTLADITTELLTTLIDHHTAGQEAAKPQARPHALRAEIRDFVRRNLDDPALTPSAIAAAHHISANYLHRIFSDQRPSLAAWIRSQRLERLRRDLTDPRLNSHSITALAARRGFTNSAHVSRLFHRAYGTTPRDYRRQALAGPKAGLRDGTGT